MTTINYIISSLLALCILSCDSKEASSIEEKEGENKVIKSPKENNTKEKLAPTKPDITFNTEKENALDSLGNFILHLPDTSTLKDIQKKRHWTESASYLYLINYYNTSTEKDSIEYYEWEPNNICAFQQTFEGEIKYSIWQCRESGGITEIIDFPKLELQQAKAFIKTLFHDPYNSWVSNYRYEPDGAGCFYEIKQSKSRTVIDIFCGC